jgi:predicted polyphosphate/ATP-dependent NAD kinase
VANPASARDVRRLVADAVLVTAHQKVSLVRRVLAGLGSVGVERVLCMTDLSGISASLSAVAGGPAARAWPAVSFVEQALTGTVADTAAAVEAMVAAGAGAIVVVGGDGTNAAVAGACGDVPIASVSTGTNNAFPSNAEPTVVGIAAGLVASGRLDAAGAACRAKVLTVGTGGHQHRALVDVAVTSSDGVGAGAVWDPATVRELFLCFAEPHAIGLSSIGGHLRAVGRHDPNGLRVRLGRPAIATVRVPLAPGLMADIDVAGVGELAAGVAMQVSAPTGVVAVDGERAVRFGPADTVTVTLSAGGPLTIDVEQAMRSASAAGLLARTAAAAREPAEAPPTRRGHP